MALPLRRERPGMAQGESRAKRDQRQDLISSGSLDPAVPEAGALADSSSQSRMSCHGPGIVPQILGSPFVCDS